MLLFCYVKPSLGSCLVHCQLWMQYCDELTCGCRREKCFLRNEGKGQSEWEIKEHTFYIFHWKSLTLNVVKGQKCKPHDSTFDVTYYTVKGGTDLYIQENAYSSRKVILHIWSKHIMWLKEHNDDLMVSQFKLTVFFVCTCIDILPAERSSEMGDLTIFISQFKNVILQTWPFLLSFKFGRIVMNQENKYLIFRLVS